MNYEECKTCQYGIDECFIIDYSHYIDRCPCLMCLVKSMCKDECHERAYLCSIIFGEAYRKNENKNRNR